MRIFALMPHNSNLASVLAGSGGFIGSQIVLAILFRSRLTLWHWAGIVMVSIGTTIAAIS
jgi:hypothetical protein